MNFGTMTVSGGTLSGNTAVNSGGGIQNDFGTVYLDASSIIGSREGSPAIPI